MVLNYNMSNHSKRVIKSFKQKKTGEFRRCTVCRRNLPMSHYISERFFKCRVCEMERRRHLPKKKLTDKQNKQKNDAAKNRKKQLKILIKDYKHIEMTIDKVIEHLTKRAVS